MAPRGVDDSFGGYRTRLVETLRAKGIDSLPVLAAFASTPRHLFVPEALKNQAYEDTSLPIGHGQTISQPSTHARYLEALELSGVERVLEVGTGTGYQAALLSHLAQHVTTLERIPELAARAREALRAAACSNVSLVEGDGTRGWLPMAPYDAILIAASGPHVPPPLLGQLAPNGRLVFPQDRDGRQILVKLEKGIDGTIAERELGEVRFVPLRGQHGRS